LLLLQVYQLSIGAACGLSWPSDRLVVQVLDDSTDPVVKVRLLTNPIGIISANDAAVSSKLFFVPPFASPVGGSSKKTIEKRVSVEGGSKTKI
jgi:hypothetical protein